MPNGNDNLKIKTVFGDEYEEELTFSPEEMQPIEVAEALESDLLFGKTEKQIKKAKKIFGPNEIRGEFRLSFRESFRNQIKGLTAVFLMASSLIMYIFRPTELTYPVMAVVIALIAFFNAFIEFRASIALKLPKKYSSLKAKVMRDGEEMWIDSRQLVPGDIIALEEGMMVPADCRLIDDMGIAALETHVSGREESVVKDSRYIARNGEEAIFANMLYAGSIITAGHGSAIVCRIGKDTLTRRMRSGNDDHTPIIIKYIQKLSRFISVFSIISSVLLLFMGIAVGADITNWFICSLAIGASSLCDSMVSLAAASLGFGANKMTEDGMVIKNYNCIQTLAKATTVMCGKKLAFPPKKIMLTGLYFSGRFYDREKRPDAQAEELLRLMLVCSDARKVTTAEKRKKRGLPEYKGSPLDGAVVEYFEEWNKPIGPLHEQYIRMEAEYTLSGDISRMLVLHNDKNTVIVRGSPENILSRCAGYTLDGNDYKLSDFTRKKILSAAEDSARTNSFLIAVACGETMAEELRDIDAEKRLIFKGFISFSSSLAPGVAEAVYRCENAGIDTILNSDDAYYVALNSAKSAGIISDESQIITAEQIRESDRGLFIANSQYYKLFLNVDDSEWLDIVRLRKSNNHITAVTAERINELPIMKESDVSIVPESSCDTLKQTADMMLLGSGINLIADGILNAKTICRRISSVITYLPGAMIMLLVASVFTVCYNQIPAFRAQDVLFGGIIFNMAFAFALAFEPRHVKNLRDNFRFNHEKPMLSDFIYPLMFSVGGGIILFVCSAATQCYTSTLIGFAAMLFLYACSIGDHGGFFATKRFGSRLLYICGFAIAAILAILIFTPLGIKFGYSVPDPAKLLTTLILTVGYASGTQIFRYFMQNKDQDNVKKSKKTKNKKSKKQEETVEAEDEHSEEQTDEPYELEDDPQEEFDEENEEYNINERSNDDDTDNC